MKKKINYCSDTVSHKHLWELDNCIRNEDGDVIFFPTCQACGIIDDKHGYNKSEAERTKQHDHIWGSGINLGIIDTRSCTHCGASAALVSDYGLDGLF